MSSLHCNGIVQKNNDICFENIESEGKLEDATHSMPPTLSSQPSLQESDLDDDLLKLIGESEELGIDIF